MTEAMLQNVVQLILYLTPGFLVLSLYHKKYPARKESDIHVIGWSLIYSVIVMAFVTLVDGWFKENPLHSNCLTKVDGTKVPDFWFVVVLFATSSAVFGIKVGWQELRFWLAHRIPKLMWLAPDPQTIWAKINQKWNTDWVVVFLQDDSIYTGQIKYYTFNPDTEDQDFLISKASKVNKELNVEYEVDGIGVYLNTKQVKRIEFIPSGDSSTYPAQNDKEEEMVMPERLDILENHMKHVKIITIVAVIILLSTTVTSIVFGSRALEQTKQLTAVIRAQTKQDRQTNKPKSEIKPTPNNAGSQTNTTATKEHANIVTAYATAVLALFTFIYMILNYLNLRELKRQRIDDALPFVAGTWKTLDDASHHRRFVIQNFGPGTARRLFLLT